MAELERDVCSMSADVTTLYDVIEATWPPASLTEVGPFTIRDGAGGGKRVSAATINQPVTADDLPIAEAAMQALGQAPIVHDPARRG